jgi:hemerythrin-like metal-binding protein
MALMTWEESMSIGVPEVDAQHQRLFDMANEVAAVLEQGFDRQAVDQALRALCDYAVEHFAAEEALMDPEGYPEYDRHLNEHLNCTTKALDFLEAFSEEKEVDMAEFLQFVAFWIRDHVLNMDQTLGAYLKKQG